MIRQRRFAFTCVAVALSALGMSACSQSAPDQAETQGAAASLTVRVATPDHRSWPLEISASGALKPWQEMIISAETGPYRITALNADVGSWVRQGQTLAALSRASLEADQARLQAAVAEAEANLGRARSDVARADAIEDSGALSAQQIESYRVAARTAQAQLASARAQLRGTEVQLAQTAVRAPDAGVVSSRSANLGKVVSPGEELFRMVRRGVVEWQAELDAKQLPLTRVGQSAQVTLPGGAVVRGTVRLVSPTLADATGRGIAYVRLPAGSAAKAGMYASGQLSVGDAEAMTVPETAVVFRDNAAYVFVLQQDSTVRQVKVEAGARREQRFAITGLADRVQVVTTGAAFLADRAAVRVETSR